MRGQVIREGTRIVAGALDRLREGKFASGGGMKLNAGPASTRGSLLRQVHGEDPHERAVRILSIDGGGLRGLLPAMVLAEIEARTGRHLTQPFDIVAGTSTGSVLGLGLAVPGPEAGVPRWNAGDGVELYRRHLPEVFERSR